MALAKRNVSRSGGASLSCFGGGTTVEVPQTAQLDSPAPTIDEQLRQRVGRPAVFEFDEFSDNT
jgi:hypothetical protein